MQKRTAARERGSALDGGTLDGGAHDGGAALDGDAANAVALDGDAALDGGALDGGALGDSAALDGGALDGGRRRCGTRWRPSRPRQRTKALMPLLEPARSLAHARLGTPRFDLAHQVQR